MNKSIEGRVYLCVLDDSEHVGRVTLLFPGNVFDKDQLIVSVSRGKRVCVSGDMVPGTPQLLMKVDRVEILKGS